jgi:integrase
MNEITVIDNLILEVPQDDQDNLDKLVKLVTADLISDNSKRTYEDAILHFLHWWVNEGRPVFCKDLVLRYRLTLKDHGYAPATINLRLTVIRKLAKVAIDEGLSTFAQGVGVLRIKDIPMRGVRAGNWLGKDQAEQLLKAPDKTTHEGLRDRAILSVLIGAGLRRSEVAALAVDHIQQREGRWVIVDLTGKGGRVRSVPISEWVRAAIDAWCQEAQIEKGYIFISLDRKYNRCTTRPHLTAQSILDIVKRYARVCGLNIAPHDCRRTFAQLARKGGAALDQIQQSLGHSTIATTERYLNTAQDLANAPCDFLGIAI